MKAYLFDSNDILDYLQKISLVITWLPFLIWYIRIVGRTEFWWIPIEVWIHSTQRFHDRRINKKQTCSTRFYNFLRVHPIPIGKLRKEEINFIQIRRIIFTSDAPNAFPSRWRDSLCWLDEPHWNICAFSSELRDFPLRWRPLFTFTNTRSPHNRTRCVFCPANVAWDHDPFMFQPLPSWKTKGHLHILQFIHA